VSTPGEIDGWYRIRRDVQAIELMAPSLLRAFPGLDVAEFHTMHCVVAYTGHGMPYIDVIQPGELFIAAGGNGHSAKWSSALGELAASLVLNDGWVDPLPADRFVVQWEGEVDSWAGRGLLTDRRR
jgi:glycine/D-amino acid oxidase-like deaminating enzyme